MGREGGAKAGRGEGGGDRREGTDEWKDEKCRRVPLGGGSGEEERRCMDWEQVEGGRRRMGQNDSTGVDVVTENTESWGGKMERRLSGTGEEDIGREK